MFHEVCSVERRVSKLAGSLVVTLFQIYWSVKPKFHYADFPETSPGSRHSGIWASPVCQWKNFQNLYECTIGSGTSGRRIRIQDIRIRRPPAGNRSAANVNCERAIARGRPAIAAGGQRERVHSVDVMSTVCR